MKLFTKIPRVPYSFGDTVTVYPYESEYPPFSAQIIGINWVPPWGTVEYTILEDNGSTSDGYTDDMFSPKDFHIKAGY